MDVCEKQKATSEGLTQEFLVLGPVLDRLQQLPSWNSHSSRWPVYSKFIAHLANGPYTTFLPEHFGANPIYSPEHKSSFDIWRGVSNRQFKGVGTTIEIECPLDLATYVRGLLLLTIDDVYELIESSERAELMDLLNYLPQKENDTNQIAKAYLSYRHLVSAKIAARLGHEPRDTTKQILEMYVGDGEKRAVMVIVRNTASVVADKLTFGISSALEKIWTTFAAWRTSKNSDPRTRDLTKLSKETKDSVLQQNAVISAAMRDILEQERDAPMGHIERDLRVFQPGIRDTEIGGH